MMVIIWVLQRLCLCYFLFSYFLFFDFSFFIHMEIIKKTKQKKISSFIPFPFQTLTSEESTSEFYDINDTPL